jgi:hypothetical protein
MRGLKVTKEWRGLLIRRNGEMKYISKRNRTVDRVTGQTLVEFALALPMLLFVLLGLFEVARWFHSYLAVQYASREAARFAVTGKPLMFISDGEESCEELGKPGTGQSYTLPEEYLECRTDYIKDVGIQLSKLGLLADPGQTDITKPGYLGVLVRGAPSIGGAPVIDHPGVARSKVEVRVVYNHPVNNPFFSLLLPTIRVVGSAELINEPWVGGGPELPAAFSPPDPLPPLDSDSDGWSDIDEVDVHGTLPSNPDTDGDGVREGPGEDPDPLDPCVPYPCIPVTGDG